VLDQRIEDVMQPPLPKIGAGEGIDRAADLLENAPALLVLDGGRPRTVISRTDMLSYVSPGEA
jgi:cystathionine beta-synthase